jgi:hypothetical protein
LADQHWMMSQIKQIERQVDIIQNNKTRREKCATKSTNLRDGNTLKTMCSRNPKWNA